MNAVIEEQKVTTHTDWAQQAVNKQREYFESGATRSYEFRLAQLKKLKDAIIKYADENSVDMIVIATHGHKGLNHFMLGSTAERVVRGASCPVLTVKPQQQEN